MCFIPCPRDCLLSEWSAWSRCVVDKCGNGMQNRSRYMIEAELDGGRQCPPLVDGEVHWQNIWWRHQMKTFSVVLALCAGNSPVTGEFPTQRPVTRSFDAFFDLRLNKRSNKQLWGCWFETPSRPLWRHSNDMRNFVPKAGTWGMDRYLHPAIFCGM